MDENENLGYYAYKIYLCPYCNSPSNIGENGRGLCPNCNKKIDLVNYRVFKRYDTGELPQFNQGIEAMSL